ncbi:MAG: nuclear transport factor 2 family protein [Bacteroidales bacterium]
MKKALFSILALFAAIVAANAQSPKDEVLNLVTSLDNSIVKKDSIKIKSLLTEDFIGVIPTGETFTRDLYIRFHCRPNIGLMSINSIDKDRTVVRLYGNCAIVNRRIHVSKKAPDGSARSFDVQRIEVCIQRQGKWYIAAGQGTEVSNK